MRADVFDTKRSLSGPFLVKRGVFRFGSQRPLELPFICRVVGHADITVDESRYVADFLLKLSTSAVDARKCIDYNIEFSKKFKNVVLKPLRLIRDT